MSANDFKTDLGWSESDDTTEWWNDHYRQAFPTMTSVEPVPGPSAAQRAGIDKFVVLDGGKRISVDEKLRRKAPPIDILLEIDHVPVDGSGAWPGWMTKPAQFTDYLAVGFLKYNVAIFFPFVTLQAAWIENGANWMERAISDAALDSQFQIIKSPNPKDHPRYHTRSVCVPTDILMGHMLCAMRTTTYKTTNNSNTEAYVLERQG